MPLLVVVFLSHFLRVIVCSSSSSSLNGAILEDISIKRTGGGGLYLNQAIESALEEFKIEIGDRQRFASAIYQQQHPVNCSDARIWIYGSAWIGKHGLFNQLQTMANSLLASVAAGRVFIDAGHTQYVKKSECAEQNFGCYFEPLTHCTEDLSLPPLHRTDSGSSGYSHRSSSSIDNSGRSSSGGSGSRTSSSGFGGFKGKSAGSFSSFDQSDSEQRTLQNVNFVESAAAAVEQLSSSGSEHPLARSSEDREGTVPFSSSASERTAHSAGSSAVISRVDSLSDDISSSSEPFMSRDVSDEEISEAESSSPRVAEEGARVTSSNLMSSDEQRTLMDEFENENVKRDDNAIASDSDSNSADKEAAHRRQCVRAVPRHETVENRLITALFGDARCMEGFVAKCATPWIMAEENRLTQAVVQFATSAGLYNPNRPLRWFIQQALNYVTRSNPRLRAFVEDAVRTMDGFPAASGARRVRNAIAVHIRHGDKNSGLYHSLEEYAAVLEYLSRSERIRDVFLGSDNRTAYEFLPKKLPFLRFHYLPLDWFLFGEDIRGVPGAHWILLNNDKSSVVRGATNNWREQDQGMVMLAQTILMSECRWAIGTLSSAVGQFTFTKMAQSLGPGALPQMYDMDRDLFEGCGYWMGLNWYKETQLASEGIRNEATEKGGAAFRAVCMAELKMEERRKEKAAAAAGGVRVAAP